MSALATESSDHDLCYATASMYRHIDAEVRRVTKSYDVVDEPQWQRAQVAPPVLITSAQRCNTAHVCDNRGCEHADHLYVNANRSQNI
eukprot:21233-Heterococcus_DN1.PRE.7